MRILSGTSGPGRSGTEPLERRFLEVGGGRVHSVHAGTGPPLVLLHGLSGSYRWWRAAVPALTPHFTVHMPELIGFGSSRAPFLRLPGIGGTADIVAEWMQAMGVARAAVVGHSMGGQIAIHIAAEHPERVERLGLVAAAGLPRALSRAEAWRLLSEVVPPRGWGRLDFLPTIARDALRAGPRVLGLALLNLLRDDVRPLLPRIQAPTLLIWGALDPLVPVSHGREMADTIPEARLVVLDRAAHNPMVDRPAEFNRQLLSFLSG